MNVLDLFEQYALEPSAERLQSLRQAIMKEPSYDPMALVTGTVGPMRRDGKNEEVISLIRSWMPGILLSPSAHGHLAQALAATGDEKAARIEQKISRLALDSIAATGSGDKDDPCTVLRIEDEYDIMQASNVTPVSQRQETNENGVFDVHTTEDDNEIWFRLLWLNAPSGDADAESTESSE